ncbi:AlpA family phage regulatory protein [Pseudomonas sp. FSL R10-1339]
MRERDVLDATSLSRTTLWRVMKNGQFPRPVRISPGMA